MSWRPLIGFLLLTGCMTAREGGIDGSGDPPGTDAPLYTPGAPGIGAHKLAFTRLHASNKPTLGTAAMTTTPGSIVLASVGRGDASGFALPTDNQGNAYPQLDTMHPYTRWSSSGTALYGATGIEGGAGHVVQVTTPPDDEVTLAAVEVLEATRIQDVQWNEVLGGDPLTSRSVTTTGPATLVAFWWGDADVDGDKAAVPNHGFRVVDSLLLSGALVQTAVAFKNVSEAGTYDVTWSARPVQGAQLWLIAVQ